MASRILISRLHSYLSLPAVRSIFLSGSSPPAPCFSSAPLSFLSRSAGPPPPSCLPPPSPLSTQSASSRPFSSFAASPPSPATRLFVTTSRPSPRSSGDFLPSSYRTSKHYYTFTRQVLHLRDSSIYATDQKRWATRVAHLKSEYDQGKISIGPPRGETEKDSKDKGVTYVGPITSTIKKVKLLSLSTCCLSVSLGPVITFMTSPGMNVILKGGVAMTVIFLSASTTAALHWFVSPYIHKLRWEPGSDSIDVEMMSWLATPLPKTIKFSDIRPPETNRPFVTFKADDNFYFVDVEHCHNKALLARLTPQKTAHGSAFKNL
ncbi:uncharacterized protein LOC121980440 [Zingiber officinale]|uniref:Transmembrane protein n=1 Tax=Zingiber officinale TaxID=94328 RepID=A0A8J5GFJ9_ZINOF|nr:uncharacterized protein LOC121980440 [Zingiber officinale]KAG6506567.1 hypothetical protein ZIOFF_031891 [Zingiber officinale]